MNAHQMFDSSSSQCPVCHPTEATRLEPAVCGLLTCRACRERLVISWSGHYVRDPFTLRHLVTTQKLRRESRPLARIFRDFGVARYASVVTMLSGLIFVGVTLLTLGEFSRQEVNSAQPEPSGLMR